MMHRLLLGLNLAGCVWASGPAVSAQFYYVEDDAARRSLEQNHGRVTLLSPVWFHVRRDGQVEDRADRSMVEWAARHKVALMPVVVNGDFNTLTATAVLRDAAVGTRTSNALIAACARYGFAGIQLDFENIAPADREAYAAFVGKLAERMHRVGRKLSVAVGAPVAPNSALDAQTHTWTASVHAQSHDYASLAKAADFLTLMAYDEYTSADAPGPVAGMPWVRACIEKMLTWTQAKKLMLGVPLYHRRWAGRTVTTGPAPDARKLAIEHRVSSRVHPVQLERVVEFHSGGVPNRIWYADAAAVEARIGLVQEYKLAGFSAWRMGQEDPEIWRHAAVADGAEGRRIQ